MTEAFNEDENTVDALAAKMAELTKQLEEFEKESAPIEAAHTTIEAEKKKIKEEAEQRIRELNAKDLEFRENLYEFKKKARAVKIAHESLERQLDQARRLKKIKEGAEELEERWDALTIGAPWREWAHDHQISAGHKITLNKRMILADTMGLGKTLSALLTLDLIKAATESSSPDNPYSEELDAYGNPIAGTGVTYPCGNKVLYVAPSTMMGNVAREVKRWAPHRSVVTLGNKPKATRRFLIETMKDHNEYVVLINYEAWRKDLQLVDDLIDIEFDTVIIDEAHNIKDQKTSAHRGVKRIIRESNEGYGVPFIIPMTGTPILNRPQEMFSLLTLVDWRHFHSERYFLSDYCRQDPYTLKWSFRPGGLEALASRIGNLFLRRTKEQAGIKLPPKTVIVHELDIDPEKYPNQCRARDEMRRWGSVFLSSDQSKAVTAAAAIAMYTRLRQIETWPAGIVIKDPLTKDIVLQLDVEESQKVDEIIAWENGELNEWGGLLPEVISDERAVVFSMFKAPLHEIQERCKKAGIRAVVLDGDTPSNLREEILQDFDNNYCSKVRSENKWDVVLANYRVGGVGANLTSATQLFVLDSEWSPGKRDQAIDRIHRIGQDKPVTIHKLQMVNTIDSWMDNIMAQKQDMVDGFETVAADSLSDILREGLDSGLI